MSQYRRSPRTLGHAIEALGRGLAPPTLLAEAQQRWPEAVGAEIAAEATPTAERAGVLTISCSSSLWAHELTLMAPDVIARLNERLARGVIARLRCVAA